MFHLIVIVLIVVAFIKRKEIKLFIEQFKREKNKYDAMYSEQLYRDIINKIPETAFVDNNRNSRRFYPWAVNQQQREVLIKSGYKPY